MSPDKVAQEPASACCVDVGEDPGPHLSLSCKALLHREQEDDIVPPVHFLLPFVLEAELSETWDSSAIIFPLTRVWQGPFAAARIPASPQRLLQAERRGSLCVGRPTVRRPPEKQRRTGWHTRLAGCNLLP